MLESQEISWVEIQDGSRSIFEKKMVDGFLEKLAEKFLKDLLKNAMKIPQGFSRNIFEKKNLKASGAKLSIKKLH